MATNYTVQQGDCLASLGDKFGIPWKIIWNHANNAALKQKRKNPDVLNPGDVLFIPDKKVKEDSGSTEKKHVFKKKADKVWLRLRLLEEFKPRAYLKYTLEVNRKEISGRTDGQGKLEQKIPASAKEVWIRTDQDVYNLKLGHLNPVEEETGVKQRLTNLGYLGRNATANQLVAAIKAFQEKHNLDPTGVITDALRNLLVKVHGS
jgi:murein DD-endopeptidase MepM/ murein hydrolase activator NlpD